MSVCEKGPDRKAREGRKERLTAIHSPGHPLALSDIAPAHPEPVLAYLVKILLFAPYRSGDESE